MVLIPEPEVQPAGKSDFGVQDNPSTVELNPEVEVHHSGSAGVVEVVAVATVVCVVVALTAFTFTVALTVFVHPGPFTV